MLRPQRHATILKAFEKVWRDGIDVALVIVGKMGWKVNALADKLRRHREAGQHLFWLDGASDGDLQQLLNRTTALIQASIAEGFGAELVAPHALYTDARERNSARWSGSTRDWTAIGAVTLNPERDAVVAAHSTVTDRQLLAA